MSSDATSRPYVFIGSSSESHRIAQAIQAQIKQCETEIWSQGFFSPGRGYLEDLTARLRDFDFAILILAADDLIVSRDQEQAAPRDNVLLELGMFIGRIGRARTFAIYDEESGVKIPSDLAGIKLLTYRRPSKGTLDAALGAVCYQISTAVESLGKRTRSQPTAAAVKTEEERKEFEKEAAQRVEVTKGSLHGDMTAPPSIDLWYEQLRPVLHQSSLYTTPTYWLDPNLNVLDWNLAFELVFPDLTPILQYRHVNEFIARMANFEDVFRHGREFSKRVHEGYMPTCDTEPLVYRSRRYGDVTMLKIATQLHDSQGDLRGWAVSLLLRQLDWDSFQRDLEEQIAEHKLWSIYAPSYNRVLQGFPPYQALLRDVASVVPDDAASVLDVGAGTGNSTEVLLNRGFCVVSLENNPEMIQAMRARNFDSARHRVLKASAQDLNNLRSVEDGTFDAATLVNVLYSLKDPFACLTGVHRVLKPGGVMGFSTTHSAVSLDQLLAAIKDHLEVTGRLGQLRDDYDRLYQINKNIERTIARRFSAEQYEAMVKQAGFEVLRSEVYTYEGAVMLVHARKT